MSEWKKIMMLRTLGTMIRFIWLLLTAAHCNPVLKERVKMALDLALQDQS